MPKIAYVTKSFKPESRRRIDLANEILDEYRAQGFDLTLRTLYYQFVSRNLIPNTEKSYDALGSLLSDARLAGLIDWNAIEDKTRHVRMNNHWESPSEIIEAVADQYRRDLWEGQTIRPFVYIEKDALVGIVGGVCSELDVPLLSCRGYVSQSEMWRSAMRMVQHEREGLTTLVLHFGDHDPSGLDMSRDLQERLQMFGSEAKLIRVALNMNQIEQYGPPPNPAKVTDSRFAAYQQEYGDDSWELDALEPSVIVDLVRTHVEELIDQDAWDAALSKQESQKDQLQKVSRQWDKIVKRLS